MSVPGGIAFACYNCCTATLWLYLIAESGVGLAYILSQYMTIDTVLLNQVVNDWETVPFTDIRITDEWTCHNLTHPNGQLDVSVNNTQPLTESIDQDQGEWSEVFTRIWYGLDYGCNCVGVWGPSHYDMTDFNNKFNIGMSCTPQMINAGCGTVPPRFPVFQGQFFGKRVCGYRAGASFLNVTRPDEKNNCPSGTSLCIPDQTLVFPGIFNLTGDNTTSPETYEEITGTSAQNSICYPPAEHSIKCPITDIRVIENNVTSEFESQNYTVLTFNETASIAFSRSVPQLPITTIKTSLKPCLNSLYQSPSAIYENAFHLGEIMNIKGCPYVQESDEYFDPRYYDSGLRTDELTIQTDNGVMQILDNLENSSKYDFDDRDVWPVYSYNRPTIPWRLECE